MDDIEIFRLDIKDQNVPEWHKDIVCERLENYKTDKSKSLDFDKIIDEIEKICNVPSNPASLAKTYI